jgi:hypothetical protein
VFILLDAEPKDLVTVYDFMNEVDDKPVLGIEDLENYSPDGDFHLLDLVTEYEDPATQRWSEMVLASKGARLFSDHENKNSPLYAGKLPRVKTDFDKLIAGAKFADGRAAYFREFNVNYIGRTNLSPRNVILLDNKKGNAQHSPLIDETLKPLYQHMEEDWWGSCGIVSSGNVDRLEKFFDEFIDEVVPLGYTSGSFAKLKFFGLDYAQLPVPRDDPKWGIQVREIANRLSYKLSLE